MPTTKTRHLTTTSASVFMAALVTASCGTASGDGTISPSTPSPSATRAASENVAASPTTTSPVAKKPPAPTQLRATNGTDYSACMGGDCEIAVSKPVTIPLSDFPTDAGPLTVQAVSAGSVRLRMALPAGGDLSVTIKKGCTAAFYGNNASGLVITSCSREPEDITGMYVKQLVTVRSITNRVAILKLKSE